MNNNNLMPADGDYILAPTGQLGGMTAVSEVGGRHLEDFTEETDARRFIRARMESEHFWPDVWACSDHGNLSLVDLSLDKM